MSGEAFTREEERLPQSKAFAIQHDELRGRTLVDLYQKDTAYARSKDLHGHCMTYAAAYADTMLQRLQEEQPNYFEEKGVERHEMLVHLQNNICLPVTKAHNLQFRKTTADIKERMHTTDVIRRLNNGGDKFHPYL